MRRCAEKSALAPACVSPHNPPATMLRPTCGIRLFRSLLCLAVMLLASAVPAAEPPPPAADAASPKAPPERTYSRAPFVHRIPVLDEDGTVIRPTKPGEEAAPNASSKPMSQATTCGKCH